MSALIHVIQRFEAGFPDVTEQEYRKLMLFSVSGIFIILLILALALVMTVGNIRPWEEKPCGSR
jgi:hypothetical protein